MKIRHLLLTLVSFIVLGTVASCKKEDKKSKTELLTAGSWKMSAHTIVFGAVTYDAYKDMEACDKDDFITFKAGGVVEFNQGAVKCDEEDSQVETGQWSFAENETKLIMAGESASIVSLTSAELKVTYSYSTEEGTAVGTSTFTH